MEGELPSAAEAAERDVEPGSEALGRALDAMMGGATDARVRAELMTESATVLDAFSRLRDPMGLREAMALAGLLARRTAELGVSGVTFSSVVEALLVTISPRLSETDARALRGLMTEAYATARVEEDRGRELAARVEATRPFTVGAHCVALVLQGPADAEWIGAAAEGLGPLLLQADARAVLCVAHLVGEQSDAVLGELSAVVDVAAVVGARVVFEAPRELAVVLRGRVGDRATVIVDDVAAALEEAVSLVGASPADAVRARVAGLLKRFGV